MRVCENNTSTGNKIRYEVSDSSESEADLAIDDQVAGRTLSVCVCVCE